MWQRGHKSVIKADGLGQGVDKEAKEKSEASVLHASQKKKKKNVLEEKGTDHVKSNMKIKVNHQICQGGGHFSLV